ncbi:S-layer homology domain-containing protein [Paenibacillus sp. ov031]|uniref:S-layer homology domain-containing protein n=1 Tax=Paenibacillus sp. ov031 TaxID=1761879 RepID=UPI00091C25AC|nr:S-layer homology domain-containing protein [Paenibacillus sp. ov031]SHN85611.1 S-layer homology domain-containing protein [Paenibacillus sp. ov031]
MKKNHFISSILAASLLTTPLWTTQANAAVSFTDIDKSYAKDAIVELQNEGIIAGFSDGRFNPSGMITRQDFAILVAKTLKLDVTNNVPSNPTFTDIPVTSYAYASVEAVYQAGIFKGMGSGKFGSGKTLSRQDMVVTLMRAKGTDVTGKAASLTFKDSATISKYAKDAVGAALEAGYIIGDQNNMFKPVLQADRQAAALTASRLLQTIKETTGPQPEPVPTPTPTPEVIPTPVPTPAPSTSSNNSGSSSGGSSDSGNMNPSVPADTTAPTVDVSKFSIIDNNSGTWDQVQGDSGAVSEEGAVVTFYRWTDTNTNEVVDEGELEEGIPLAKSKSDGSLALTKLKNLTPGDYTFVVTAKDSAGNESPKDAAHVFTFTLVNGDKPVAVPTIRSSNYGFDSNNSKAKYLQVQTVNPAFSLYYNVGESFVDGTIEYSTNAFQFSVNDSYEIDGESYTIDSSQISNDGHTLKLKVTVEADTRITLVLLDKRNNDISQNDFIIRADADGEGLTKSVSEENEKLIVHFVIYG